MISSEITTINDFGSRRLTIRFLTAGEAVPRHYTVLPVGQARSVRTDADRNICLLEVSLGTAEDNPHDKWPVSQVIHHIRQWGLGLSEEDEQEIRRLFPIPWYRTGDYHADSPFPPDTMCDNCGEHQAHSFWLGDRNPDNKYDPFGYDGIWCSCCMWQEQLKKAEEKLEKLKKWIPELQAKLSAGCKKEEKTRD